MSKINLVENLIKVILLSFFLTLGVALTIKPVKVCAEEYSVNAISGEGTIDADSLNVRIGPGKDYDSIGSVKNGASVVITGEADGWYQIEYSGKAGFVSAQYVQIEGELTEAEVDDESEAVDKSADKKNKGKDKEDTLEEIGEPEEGSFVSRYKMLLVIPVVLVILGIVISIIFTLRRGDDYDEYDDDYDEYDDYDDYDDGYDDYDDGYDDYDDGYDDYDDGYDDYDDGYDDYDDDYDDYEEEYDSRKRVKSRRGDRKNKKSDYYSDTEDEYYDEYEDEAENESDCFDERTDSRRDVVRKETRRFEGTSRKSDREAPRTRKGRKDDEPATPQKKEMVIREEDYKVNIDPKFFDTQTIIEQPAAVTGYIPGQMDREEKISMVESEISRLQEEVDKLKQESESAKAESSDN